MQIWAFIKNCKLSTKVAVISLLLMIISAYSFGFVVSIQHIEIQAYIEASRYDLPPNYANIALSLLAFGFACLCALACTAAIIYKMLCGTKRIITNDFLMMQSLLKPLNRR